MQRYVCIILLVIFGSIGILLWIKPQYVVSVVKSDSMQPTLHRGDLLIAQLQFEPQLQDIVFVQLPIPKEFAQEVICHRIVAKQGIFFVTKGDANAFEDEWLYNDDKEEGSSETNAGFRRQQIIAKVRWHFPMIGYPALLIRETLLAKVNSLDYTR
eukprot:03989.XXX_37566_37026_1 [CDS] Oithona nana genome sequencing.